MSERTEGEQAVGSFSSHSIKHFCIPKSTSISYTSPRWIYLTLSVPAAASDGVVVGVLRRRDFPAMLYTLCSFVLSFRSLYLQISLSFPVLRQKLWGYVLIQSISFASRRWPCDNKELETERLRNFVFCVGMDRECERGRGGVRETDTRTRKPGTRSSEVIYSFAGT